MSIRTNANAPGQGRASGAYDSRTTTFYYPDPHTVHGQTLAAFLQGEQLTTLEARPRLHTTTLTQAVQKLRRDGWPVVTERVTVPTADGDRKAHIGRYSLLPETIAEAGLYGQQYAAQCAQVKAEGQQP